MRWLAVVHHLPDRTRLRTPALRNAPAACERLADALAAIAGVREVIVRPYTGSALIFHDERVAPSALLETAARTLCRA